MRFLKYAAVTALQLVQILIVLAMFGVASTAFETIVIASLIYIYVMLAVAFRQAQQLLNNLDRTNFARFLEVKAALGTPSTPEERDSLRELRDATLNPGFMYWAPLLGLSLVSVTALIFLIGALA